MEKKFMDFPMYKKITSTKQLDILNQSDALSESIKLWATSSKGEKIRSKTGGILLRYIGKVMDSETISSMKTDLIYGLQQEFEPHITVVKCEIIPDYINNLYNIEVVGYNTEFNLGVNTNFLLNNEI